MSGLVLQSCNACGHRWQFRRGGCPSCGSADVSEIEAGGAGTVWSVTQVMRAPLPELDVPGGYAIALVTLNEGPRVMCRAEDGLPIGRKVIVSLGTDGLPRATRT